MEMPPRSTYLKTSFPGFELPAPQGPAPDDLLGLWTFRIGRFGCLDSETHGGVIHFLEQGQVFGGDSDYSFAGRWTLHDTELRSVLRVVKHRRSFGPDSVFGPAPEPFDLAFNAHAINGDYFEGTSRRAGYPDFRAVMHRVREADYREPPRLPRP